MNEELKQEITQLIEDALHKMSVSSQRTTYHKHTLTDAGQIEAGKEIIGAPQTAITVVNNTALSTGGGAVLSSSDQTVLDNVRNRVNEIYTRLQNLGLLK